MSPPPQTSGPSSAPPSQIIIDKSRVVSDVDGLNVTVRRQGRLPDVSWQTGSLCTVLIFFSFTFLFLTTRGLSIWHSNSAVSYSLPVFLPPLVFWEVKWCLWFSGWCSLGPECGITGCATFGSCCWKERLFSSLWNQWTNVFCCTGLTLSPELFLIIHKSPCILHWGEKIIQ